MEVQKINVLLRLPFYSIAVFRLNELLDESDKLALQQLLVREDTLSGLAALNQDAKHFGYQMMVMERQKRCTRTCVSVDESAAADVGDFATESQLSRQSRSLLYHLRFAPGDIVKSCVCGAGASC